MTTKELINQYVTAHADNRWMDASELEALLTEFAEKLKEPVSEDLADASNNYCLNIRKGYPRVKDEIDIFICNAFKVGAQWQKEKIMKDAIEGWVARDECGDIAIFSDKPHRDLGLGMWTPARHAFLFPRKDEYSDVTWNSEPQKVKVIIIKE